MNCPQCKGYSLEPKELEPGLVVAACMKCQGTMVSLMNYRFWVDQIADTTEINALNLETTQVDDSQSAKVCPKCSKLMTKFQIGPDAVNRLDLCTGCDEAWLDKGEWGLLKQLDLADKLPKIFTDAWQRNVRLARQQKKHDSRYEALLGADDFARVNEFKKWLDAHPEKQAIKQYLITKLD